MWFHSFEKLLVSTGFLEESSVLTPVMVTWDRMKLPKTVAIWSPGMERTVGDPTN